jgi:rubrerythrin
LTGYRAGLPHLQGNSKKQLLYREERVMEERMNALEMALKNEMRERNFYLKHAERTSNPLGRAMFAQIAAEELEHYERLSQLAEIWKKDQKWPETIPLKVKETAVKAVFGTAARGTAPTAGDDDDLKAVRVAIDFEAKGAQFYAELRDKSVDPKEKAFFELLANIEHEHFTSLKDTEEFFANPAGWFLKREASGLDGA